MNNELQIWLDELNLTQIEAAKLLGITARTMNRWMSNSEEMTEPAKLAFKAWITLKDHNLPWQPDVTDICGDVSSEIGKLRNKSMGIKDILDLPALMLPWQINMRSKIVTLETVHLSFALIPDDEIGFVPINFWCDDSNDLNHKQLFNSAIKYVYDYIKGSNDKN